MVLTVSQIYWAKDVHMNLESGDNVYLSMKAFEQKCYEVNNVYTIETFIENKILEMKSLTFVSIRLYHFQFEGPQRTGSNGSRRTAKTSARRHHQLDHSRRACQRHNYASRREQSIVKVKYQILSSRPTSIVQDISMIA